MTQVNIEQPFRTALQHCQAGRLAEAEGLFKQILAQQPDCPQALSNLGEIYRTTGRTDQAVAAHRQAIALKADVAESHYNLGVALQDRGELEQAASAFRQAIALKPNFPAAYNNLAMALKDRGQLDEAIAALRQAIALQPDYPAAHINLGNTLMHNGQLDQAIAAYRQAIALKPNWAEAYCTLGNALRAAGRMDQAIAALRRAVALDRALPDGHAYLATTLKDAGQVDEAIAAYRQAIALRPIWPEAHSSLLFALHLDPASDAHAIAQEHRRWNQLHAEPLRPLIRPHDNDRNPERRLRIGYVSGDYCNHVSAWGIEANLAHHDRAAFEVFCYSSGGIQDAVTRRLQNYGHPWRSITTLDDGQAAELIRADGIDILVDLSLHTAHNRLLVFARKPAPVQVAHLAYPATTGLSAIDYRVTDAFLDPVGVSEAFNSETLVRLPRGWYCYVREDDPPVQAPPSSQRGHITFGSLNRPAKITPPVLDLWAQILRGLPGSRLLMLSPGDGGRLLQQFARHGVDTQRVQFVERTHKADYLGLYHEIDVGLDPFPCNGGVTTCDALWMGVPVVTLRGQTSMGRAGVSILSTIGLTELIADTPEQYVRIALELATDAPRLESLRLGLRPRMKTSPLTDAAGYTRDLETAYRRMWRQWCATGL